MRSPPHASPHRCSHIHVYCGHVTADVVAVIARLPLRQSALLRVTSLLCRPHLTLHPCRREHQPLVQLASSRHHFLAHTPPLLKPLHYGHRPRNLLISILPTFSVPLVHQSEKKSEGTRYPLFSATTLHPTHATTPVSSGRICLGHRLCLDITSLCSPPFLLSTARALGMPLSSSSLVKLPHAGRRLHPAVSADTVSSFYFFLSASHVPDPPLHFPSTNCVIRPHELTPLFSSPNSVEPTTTAAILPLVSLP